MAVGGAVPKGQRQGLQIFPLRSSGAIPAPVGNGMLGKYPQVHVKEESRGRARHPGTQLTLRFLPQAIPDLQSRQLQILQKPPSMVPLMKHESCLNLALLKTVYLDANLGPASPSHEINATTAVRTTQTTPASQMASRDQSLTSTEAAPSREAKSTAIYPTGRQNVHHLAKEASPSTAPGTVSANSPPASQAGA